MTIVKIVSYRVIVNGKVVLRRATPSAMIAARRQAVANGDTISIRKER